MSTAPGDGAPDAPESAAEEATTPGPFDQLAPTTLVLVRHGVTPHTTGRRFSGGLGGDNPALSQEGRDQVGETARWLLDLRDQVDAVIASPVRRTRESADIIAAELDLPVEEEPGFAEMEFGEWDGLTFSEVAQRDQAGLDRWFSDMAAAPPGGESFVAVQERVLAALERVLVAHAGRTVVVTSHVTPIKVLTAHALAAPLDSIFRLELAPAAVSTIAFHHDPRTGARTPSLRFFNALPPGRRTLRDTGRW